jgi:hypothetical protein
VGVKAPNKSDCQGLGSHSVREAKCDPSSTLRANYLARHAKRAEVSNAHAEDDGRENKRGFDPLDPAARQAAQLAPLLPTNPNAPLPTDPSAIAPRARVSMEELLPQLVRRIAWAGDRRKGTVQMELGAGRHAGTVVTVHADDGRVRVELQGADVEELRSRIDARLARRGIQVESVT